MAKKHQPDQNSKQNSKTTDPRKTDTDKTIKIEKSQSSSGKEINKIERKK